MDMKIAGQRVLITGASQGIGAGLAQAFAAEGCHLALTARSADKLQALAQDLRGRHGVQVDVLPLDMTQPGAVDQVAAFAGDIDVLVNNAGAIPGGNLWDVDAPAWRQGWELKVFGYIDLARAVYPRMKARGHGVILNNIGNGGQNPDFNYIAGSTGNAALMAFTCALGGRSLEDGIRVIGVNPGPVATERIAKVLRSHAARLLGDEQRSDELLAGYPLGRTATVAEVADLFVYLASPRSAYTSGTIVTVDGGISSKRSVA
ncbi:SDR family oxidoreductase [Bordetella bronchiseptica]|uniref:Short chain dehydrogenase n=3 Tax=Bordetella bronchiseptica TaxID=518 RepID=A0A0H3LIT2_BORBR|nr:SDR family oxidoreductase [Bordetella bronchiseptica]KAK60699.1 KR domain protein [Bordetella bronchiseptica 980-2]KDD51767.1 KR domain protein [Bordetella bronchiseptica OSU553]SHQ29054.1 short-chain dehydrogenase [Mycobacteroides abscessus subsp. abscessus]AMG87146.1 short-chain dehydrogenase [Bordetella bronchiseptica]AWP73472.1 short-chain dehydrogenase [Bordetella bronchiseptica]